MIIEDDRDTYIQHWSDCDQYETSGSSTPQQFLTNVLPVIANHVCARFKLHDSYVYPRLQEDLVRYIHVKFGTLRG